MLMHTYEARLKALREELDRRGLDGVVVPISDEHMSEYVGAYAQRLEWLTGFGGSAGTAVVLKDKAAMFVDGRYTIQVRDQVDGRFYEYVDISDTRPAQWIADNVGSGAKVGYDAWLHTREAVNALVKALERKGAEAVATDGNVIDSVWSDQPARPDAKLMVQPMEFSGQSLDDKCDAIAAQLKRDGQDAAVITALDSVAWVYNIRGGDVDRTPVALAYAIVAADGSATLFTALEKITDEVRKHLGNRVMISDYDAFPDALAELQGKSVLVDPERAVAAIFEKLDASGAKVTAGRDPVVLPKAIKNEAEIAGHKAAQARDGAALTRFLRWLDAEAPKGTQTELSAAAKLKDLREETGKLVDLSFDTISGAGPNGALCHYRVSEETNRTIEEGQLYLVDSGGQYRDGTTDVTRTIAVGQPTEEMRRRFTQVLKGHIALSNAVFPKGTRGGQLDILARQYLWAEGVDYAHGTGHGVGSFLGVHEGPQRIAAFSGGDEPLQKGMILSNEPGYYKTDGFGIRIENLVLVVDKVIEGAEREMLGFENLTFAPIDRNLIDLSLLSDAERTWVNRYHRDVLAIVGPQLDGEDKAFLEKACAEL